MKKISSSTRLFIEKNKEIFMPSLVLNAKSTEKDVDIKQAIAQIQSYQKAKSKLPQWTMNEDIIFPSILSVEQSSSEKTATFKATLMKGEKLIDLTGGMGVDMEKMSRNFIEAIHVEKNEELSSLAKHNLEVLGVKNVTFVADTCFNFLEKKQKADWIYIDPARRDKDGKKIVSLESYEPNILSIQETLFESANNILLKTSPMLDISLAVSQLKEVFALYIVSLENEVKELLFHLQKGANQPVIGAINLLKDSQQSFFLQRKMRKI